MKDFFQHLAENNFMPHGHCYYWDPFILWSHAISDTAIALAYLVIPLSLVHIVRKRNDFTYMWMLVLFAIFILGCGATHVFDVINIWKPYYRLDSLVRIVTAVASIGTAILLIKITPKLILFPSAKKWKEMNEELRSLNENLEQKVQERTRELMRNSAQYEFLTNAIPQIVWTANAKGESDYFNKTWYDYTGLNFEQSKAKGWKESIHPEDYEIANRNWEEAVKTNKSYQAELRIKNASKKSYRWHLSRGIPMKNEDGKVVKWFGTTTDIHDHKLQNEELARINEELDNFVYIASHDLKAPINNLEGLLYMIDKKADGKIKENISELFHLMNISVEKLKITINELADISRIQREAMEDVDQVNVEEILEEFKINNQELIKTAGADILSDLKVNKIYFSTRHLRSILHNLLNNAIKYSHPMRAPVVTISTQNTRDGMLEITVADNGMGIMPQHKSKIFQMFKRFSQDKDGTGVGLYIVKRIIEKYDGKIEVESEVDKGTTFKIFLREISNNFSNE